MSAIRYNSVGGIRMPDGDSLNWKVRGTGSGRVLALVRSGTDCKLVTDAAVQMFANQANKGRWKPAIQDMADAVDSSLQQISPEAGFEKRAQVFDSLTRRLSSIARSHPDDGIHILERAAERTFGALEGRCAPLTRQGIEEELLCQSARAVVDHRVLQPTRDEVARESQRDSSEQACYERELLSNIGQCKTPTSYLLCKSRSGRGPHAGETCAQEGNHAGATWRDVDGIARRRSMRALHVFNFTTGEKVLGTEPSSGAEREMHYYVKDAAVSKFLGSSLDAVLVL